MSRIILCNEGYGKVERLMETIQFEKIHERLTSTKQLLKTRLRDPHVLNSISGRIVSVHYVNQHYNEPVGHQCLVFDSWVNKAIAQPIFIRIMLQNVANIITIEL